MLKAQIYIYNKREILRLILQLFIDFYCLKRHYSILQNFTFITIYTFSNGMVCLSLRSAPAQNMPGVVLRNIITLALVSNFTASTASHN